MAAGAFLGAFFIVHVQEGTWEGGVAVSMAISPSHLIFHIIYNGHAYASGNDLSHLVSSFINGCQYKGSKVLKRLYYPMRLRTDWGS